MSTHWSRLLGSSWIHQMNTGFRSPLLRFFVYFAGCPPSIKCGHCLVHVHVQRMPMFLPLALPWRFGPLWRDAEVLQWVLLCQWHDPVCHWKGEHPRTWGQTQIRFWEGSWHWKRPASYSGTLGFTRSEKNYQFRVGQNLLFSAYIIYIYTYTYMYILRASIKLSAILVHRPPGYREFSLTTD